LFNSPKFNVDDNEVKYNTNLQDFVHVRVGQSCY